MSKKYKGWELIKAIALNELKAGTKFYDKRTGIEYILSENGKVYENRQYFDDEVYTQLQEDYTIKELGQADFELIEDEIDNIKELLKIEEYEVDKTDVKLNRDKINELVQAVKQLNKEIKSIKEK